MSAKMGRPKKDNPINVHRSVRLDAETDQRLEEYCRQHGISKGEAIRQGIHLLLGQKK